MRPDTPRNFKRLQLQNLKTVIFLEKLSTKNVHVRCPCKWKKKRFNLLKFIVKPGKICTLCLLNMWSRGKRMAYGEVHVC